MNFIKPLVLVSQSPQRSRLLSLMRVDFDVVSPIGDEIYHDHLSFKDQIELIAEQKAKSVRHLFHDSICIAADTVIIHNDTILGKPIDDQDAFEMLQSLSDTSHQVITGVCIASDTKTSVFSSIAEVSFHPMSDEEIRDYVNTGEPMGRSGSYSIQGGASLFVKSIKGDVNSVVGLPIAEVYQRLKTNEF